MKIEVAKSDLENSLSVSSLTTGSQGILSHYLFRIKGGKAQILSFDKKSFSLCPIVASVDGKDGDAFTVEAWRLDKWVKGVSDGVLTLTYDGNGDVIATGSRSKVRFRSLDPSKFDLVDELYEKAEESCSVSPGILVRAFGVSRWFLSNDDTQRPELCQIEARGGSIWASDRRSVCLVSTPRMGDLKIRIPGPDVPRVVKFLSDKYTMESDIRVLETIVAPEKGNSAQFFVRPDGAYVGTMRPPLDFPTLNVDPTESDQFFAKVDRSELEAAVSVLSSGAPKDHSDLTFRHEGGSLYVQMPCEAGGEDEYPLTLAKVEKREKGDGEFPGFTVDYRYIKGIISTFGLDSFDMGVNRRGAGGYITFRHADDSSDSLSNSYYTLVLWK